MWNKKDKVEYKFSELQNLAELRDYIDSTYKSHYSKNKFQSTEFISDCGNGIGFAIGNILKYAQRYGKKGTPEDARKDLMKVLHYAMIALHEHDNKNRRDSS